MKELLKAFVALIVGCVVLYFAHTLFTALNVPNFLLWTLYLLGGLMFSFFLFSLFKTNPVAKLVFSFIAGIAIIVFIQYNSSTMKLPHFFMWILYGIAGLFVLFFFINLVNIIRGQR